MGTFLFFLFYFLHAYKKHKDANKQISDFFPLRCFLNAFFNFYSLVAFCAFAWLRLCAFGAFGTFGVCKIFSSKKKKEFKTDLISSFTLLLKFILIKAWFFLITIFINHRNLFPSSQSFSIITIFFNYYNLFQLSQSFSIITIFFITMFFITIFFNLFTTCDTIFMKISQCTNSII